MVASAAGDYSPSRLLVIEAAAFLPAPIARMTVAAVVLGFAFFFVNQAASAFGSAEVIPPWLAAWLPPLLTALAAFTLLFYTEDG